MRTLAWSTCVLLLVGTPVAAWGEPPKAADRPVAAVVETTLPTDGGRIRQFAFDGDPKTCFASKGGYKAADHFTLVFDAPVRLESVEVVTGEEGGKELADGALEASADGTTFERVAAFADGTAKGRGPAKPVRAVRVHPGGASDRPLVVREVTVRLDPEGRRLPPPGRVRGGRERSAGAQGLGGEGRPGVRAALRDDLRRAGERRVRAPTLVRLTMRPPGPGVPGVAAAGGGRIVGNAKYFRDHPDDVGAMIHEAAHCVQQYPRPAGGARNPGWLVEGVADYVRFFRYEPGKLGKLTPERARYDGSYRTTAAFLGFVAARYDAGVVRKLNARMRAGKYMDEVWKELTGKTAEELGQEWRKSLAD